MKMKRTLEFTLYRERTERADGYPEKRFTIHTLE
jgi:hypothetical protein